MGKSRQKDQKSELASQGAKEPKTKAKRSRLYALRKRGPVNSRNKQYLRSERMIRHALLGWLSRRCLNLQARKVLQKAKITPPTFYLHCSDANDALIKYERELERDFMKLLPKSPKHEVIWTLFLVFIERNHDYFCATAKNCDFFLLARIINNMRGLLVGNGQISDKAYSVYMANVVATVYCWLQHDRHDKKLMDSYVKKLMRIRFYEF